MYTRTTYTGTMILDLMTTVDRAEKNVEQLLISEELHEIFTMPISMADGESAFMGAA